MAEYTITEGVESSSKPMHELIAKKGLKDALFTVSDAIADLWFYNSVEGVVIDEVSEKLIAIVNFLNDIPEADIPTLTYPTL